MIFNSLILLVGTILAFWLSAICGGGASLILIPILNLFLPGSVVPFSLTVGTLTSSVSRIALFRKYVKWEIFFWFVPFSIPSVLVGAYLIKYINPIYLQFFVALFLLANVRQLFVSRNKQEQEEKPYPKFVLAIVGFLAGFVSGITGAIGLLFNRFYLKYGLTKEEIIATRAANEIILHVVKLIIYILLGLYSEMAIYLGIAIAVGAVGSTYTVKYLLPYLSEAVFRKVGYGAMVLSGVLLLSSTSQKIIKQDNIEVGMIRKSGKNETVIKWRESDFVLEYSLDDGLEIERPINSEELPPNILAEYNKLLSQYDEILLEKVFKLGHKKSYEFYCYGNGSLTKFDFDE